MYRTYVLQTFVSQTPLQECVAVIMCRIYILLRSVGYLFIHRIILPVQLDIYISTERTKFNIFILIFSWIISSLPILIIQ